MVIIYKSQTTCHQCNVWLKLEFFFKNLPCDKRAVETVSQLLLNTAESSLRGNRSPKTELSEKDRQILFRAGINFVNVKIKATSLSVDNVQWTSWIALDSMRGYSAMCYLKQRGSEFTEYCPMSLNQPRPISNSYLRKWISQTNWIHVPRHSCLDVIFKQYEVVHLFILYWL